MATKNPAHRAQSSPPESVGLDDGNRVVAATGVKSTGSAQQRTDAHLVAAHQEDRYLLSHLARHLVDSLHRLSD